MGRLENKVAVITGAGSGMGRVTAELFAREGAIVAVTDTNVEAGQAVTAGIIAEGGRAKFWALDVSSEKAIAAAYAEIGAEFGTIDVLNGASILITLLLLFVDYYLTNRVLKELKDKKRVSNALKDLGRH